MDYCLIEKWGCNYILPEKSQAVALTEEAIFHLERSGIQYITLEDFYTSYEVRGNVDDFLLEQLSWFDNFDRLLKEAFPEADNMGVNLATIYSYAFKRLVDYVILTTRILRKFIESVKPGKIWFIGPKYSREGIDSLLTGDHSQGHPFDDALDADFKTGENPYSILIESLCKVYGIDFERLTFDAPTKPKVEFSILQSLRAAVNPHQIKCLAIKFLPASEIRSLYIFLKSRGDKSTVGRILLLQYSGLMVDFCIDARKHGFEIFVKRGHDARKLSWQPWRKGIVINRFEPIPQRHSEDMFNGILNGDLMKWINSYCGLDVSGILNSRFRYFFYKICPDMLARVQDYIEFYNKNNIDFVVTPNIWTVDEHAAVAAARLTPRTKSIGFAHGSDVYECKSRFFLVNRQYDFFFSPSSADAEHERWLVEHFNYKYPKIYEFPYFQRRFAKRGGGDRRTKHVSFAGKKPVVLYVPIIYGSRPGRSIQLNQPFPMEYVKWHRALAEFFSKRKETFFIWKGLIQVEQKFDLMAEIIQEEGYDNIRFDSGRLTRWFPYVERVLIDIPSSAFFESIYSHMPVMALYRPKYQILRKNAHGSFGSSLRAYDSIDEGLALVEEFLDGQREKYIVPFSEPDVFVPEILSAHLYTPQRKDGRLQESVREEKYTMKNKGDDNNGKDYQGEAD